jgi:histidinol dehydrogenase
MLPVNSKSMFATLCNYMEKLDKNEIDVSQARAMANLIGQANNLLNYELKRALLFANEQVRNNHRNLELKTFDSLPE